MSTKLGVGHAATAVLAAQKHWRQLDSNFSISMTQTDNGLEFSKYFEQQMKRAGIATRHTRLSRPNDNAHIERFNRTLQEECIGRCWRRSVPLLRQQEKLSCYIDYYNQERVHLGIQMRTPSQMLQRY